MARTLIRVCTGWWAALVAALFLAWLSAAHFWPPSWWLVVHRIGVMDADAGKVVRMVVVREIRRPFLADWVARVWLVRDDGLELVCTGRGGGAYDVRAVLPRTVTLGWWTDGNCRSLPPGRYMVSTIWRIDRWMMPPAVVRADSNVFSISERPQR